MHCVQKKPQRITWIEKAHLLATPSVVYIPRTKQENLCIKCRNFNTPAREAYASKRNEVRQNLIDLKKKIEIANLGLQNTNSLPLHCFVTTLDRNYETTFHKGCIENTNIFPLVHCSFLQKQKSIQGVTK